MDENKLGAVVAMIVW